MPRFTVSFTVVVTYSSTAVAFSTSSPAQVSMRSVPTIQFTTLTPCSWAAQIIPQGAAGQNWATVVSLLQSKRFHSSPSAPPYPQEW